MPSDPSFLQDLNNKNLYGRGPSMKNFALFAALFVLSVSPAFTQEVEIQILEEAIQNDSTQTSSALLTCDLAEEGEEHTDGVILLCCGECTGGKDDK
jgi:hypothetical protein